MSANVPIAATGGNDPMLGSDKKVSLFHEKEDYSSGDKNSADQVEVRHALVGECALQVSASAPRSKAHTTFTGARPSFAERLYWAEKRREFERNDPRMSQTKGIAAIFKRKQHAETKQLEAEMGPENDDDLIGLSDRQRDLNNARRVLRQAGWATVFYLITCDILGPFNAPYALASIGVVPGVLLYLLFGMYVF